MYRCMHTYSSIYIHIPICIFVCTCLMLVAKRSVPKLPLSENTVAALKSHSVQWISLVPRTIKC